jgi:hypothetical protein
MSAMHRVAATWGVCPASSTNRGEHESQSYDWSQSSTDGSSTASWLLGYGKGGLVGSALLCCAQPPYLLPLPAEAVVSRLDSPKAALLRPRASIRARLRAISSCLASSKSVRCRGWGCTVAAGTGASSTTAPLALVSAIEKCCQLGCVYACRGGRNRAFRLVQTNCLEAT